MKYGKKPAQPIAKDTLRFGTYVNLDSVLPQIPETFGHYSLVADWGLLGNDQYGDCAFAGAAHQVMLWNAIAGKTVEFTIDSVLSDYSAVTGFNPDDPSTDQGTAVPDLMNYWKSTGIADGQGVRHKIALDLALTPGDVDELCAAMYLFGAVSLGFQVPDYWQAEFQANQPWDVRRRLGIFPPKIEGGHFVFGAGRENGMTKIGTWGALVDLEDDAYAEFNDETYLTLSLEMLTNGVSPEHFDLAQLQADAQAIAA